MSKPMDSNLAGLDLDTARRIDVICRRFEADRREGRQSPVNDYLGEIPEEGRLALRSELDALEKELRRVNLDPTSPEATRPSKGAEATTIEPIRGILSQPTSCSIVAASRTSVTSAWPSEFRPTAI
jgi:hypothetical protein